MLANGDDKPIWMTELSWRTTSAVCPEGAGPGKKAEGVTNDQQTLCSYVRPIHCMAQDPYLQVARRTRCRTKARWCQADAGQTARASRCSRRCAKTSTTATQLTESCGVFTGPKIPR